jgi:hypothetical protein
MCYISSKEPTLRWDGAPIFTITDIELHNDDHPAKRYLDQALFTQKEGVICSTNNPIINVDDGNPDFLLALADRLANGDIPYPEAIRLKAAASIRDVFLNNATPRMFYECINNYANVIFKDDAHPETYRLDPKLYFRSMAKRNILAFDIHDLLHHPLQLGAWPDQFQYIALAAHLASQLPEADAKAVRLRKATRLAWIACFEESLITIEDQLVSFGCLNWLAPSETPLNKKPNIRTLSVEEQKIGFRWHYIDALKEMYKIDIANSKLIGEKLNWVERLGYNVDQSLKQLIESDDSKPFENLGYYDVLKFNVQAPTSPEELFANAIDLIQKEL